MLAGDLEIRLWANLAALGDQMNQAVGTVGKSMNSIERSVNQAKRALGALGIGLSVGYFAHLIKESIDTADRLNDLSAATSISVEHLAGLSLAAKQSGSDLDGTARAINFLSKNIGANAEEYRKLGITAKDPLEAFKQLADVFIAIEDPQTRAATMAKALGKSWAEAAPLLAAGGQRIGEMVERGERLSGVTSGMAAQADMFNDKMAELTATGGLFNRMVAPLLPLLNALADDMIKAQEKALGADRGFSILAETFRALVLIGGNVSYTFNEIGIGLYGIYAQLNALVHGDLKEFHAINDMLIDQGKQARIEFDAWEQKILGVGKAAEKAAPQIAGMAGKGGSDAAAQKFVGAGNAKEEKFNYIDTENSMQLLALEENYQNHIAYEDALTQLKVDAFNRRMEIQQANNDQLAAMLLQGNLSVIDIENMTMQQRVGTATVGFGKLIAGAGQHSMAMFQLSKAVALAQTAIELPKTVMSAYRAGTEIGGPFLGAAYAAVAGAAQLVNMNAIRSASFGGGAAGAAPSGGGVSTGLPGQTANPGTIGFEAPKQAIIINANLGDGLIPASAVRNFMELINEQIRDGVTIEQIRVA